MQDSVFQSYLILTKSWNCTKWHKSLEPELVTALPLFQGQVWDFIENPGGNTALVPFSSVFQSSIAGMCALRFCEHLDYPNYPHLFQTREDNNNEEAQSQVPEYQPGVAAFSHNKKIIKIFKWLLLSQSD